MYHTQSLIADDPAMKSRVAQCAAQEGVTDEGIDADVWTYEWRRVWASAAQWDSAWESALANENPSPGSDPSVITDQQILSQVQSMKPFKRVGP